jgi:hypothetical protein
LPTPPSSYRYLLVTLLCGLAAGCSYADDPDLRTGTLAPFILVGSNPGPGAVGVLRAAPVDVFFSVAPDAFTAADVNMRIYSGLIEAPGTVRVDLLERRLRMQPFSPLRPDLRHEVYLAGVLRGLNGVKLPKTVVFDFTTGADEGAAAAPRPAVQGAELQPAWTQRCASCHSATADTAPPMRVDLSSTEAVRRTVRALPSSAGPLLVSPGDHARSYLMLKLLGEGGILGSPMPPDGPRLADADLRRVADWIDAGAP